MRGRKIDAYWLYCRECGYEVEAVDSIEAEAGTLAAQGHYYCMRCGEKNDLPKGVA